MKKFVLAALAAGAFLLPLPASATQPGVASMTDVSAQVSVGEGRRGGVNIRVGDSHRRHESRNRRDRRHESRSRQRCEMVTTERRERGRMVKRTVKRCR